MLFALKLSVFVFSQVFSYIPSDIPDPKGYIIYNNIYIYILSACQPNLFLKMCFAGSLNGWEKNTIKGQF